MNICLIRHGETDWNLAGKFQGREDIPLNQTGIGQIKKITGYLKKSAWDEIISSPLSRAKMSAEIIRGEIGLETIHEENDFTERDLGKKSGMTVEDVTKNFPGGNLEEVEGLEPLDVLRSRTCNALVKWIKVFEGKNILIVSHGAAIHAMLSTLSEDKIEIGKNASVSLLEKCGDTIRIVFCNKNF
jgi:uncharacterized phosphatase